MNFFDEWPDAPPCPLCNTHTDEPYILVEILGTSDGSIAKGKCIHVDCILRNIRWDEERGLVA